jgi:hypothetical integral membrane protein (TIGR02206 family)
VSGRFELFGVAHLVALALTLVAAAGAVLFVRRAPALERPLRTGLAVFLCAVLASFIWFDARAGLPWQQWAPLHLCDAVVPLAALALAGKRRLPAELTWFVGCAGSLPALLTPDLGHGFPHYRFFLYFAQHGGVVVAALLLPFGLALQPARGAPLRAWLWLNAYAALVAMVDLAGDANFLYLRHKPGSATPLDWLGPWPFYLVAGGAIALGAFLLLDLPFRKRRTTAANGAA